MHGGRSSLLQGMLATRRRHAWTWLSQARARDVNVFVVGCPHTPHQIMVITVLLFIPSGPEVPSLPQASADYCAEAPRLAEPPGLPLSSIKEKPCGSLGAPTHSSCQCGVARNLCLYGVSTQRPFRTFRSAGSGRDDSWPRQSLCVASGCRNKVEPVPGAKIAK